MRKRELLKKYEKVIKLVLKLSKLLPKSFYKRILKLVRNWDSMLAIFMRFICLKNICKSCGDNVAIFSGVYLFAPEKLEIGDNVSIHPMSYIDANGEIYIGNDVSIAHSTTIMSEEHIYDDLLVNIKDQGTKGKRTVIENNVWVGAGCRILAGSRIKSGSIVAAGAVVKNTVDKYSIVGGIPAKIIKER